MKNAFEKFQGKQLNDVWSITGGREGQHDDEGAESDDRGRDNE